MRSHQISLVRRLPNVMTPPQGAGHPVAENLKSWRERREFSSIVQMSIMLPILGVVDVFNGLLTLLNKHQKFGIYRNSFNELNVTILKE